jgi:hypothetical protein
LKSRALSALLIDHSTRVTSSKHGRQKLDADDYSHNQIAESELVTNEQWEDRERKADGKISAEQCGDNAKCGT